jgi:hypothetical protein
VPSARNSQENAFWSDEEMNVERRSRVVQLGQSFPLGWRWRWLRKEGRDMACLVTAEAFEGVVLGAGGILLLFSDA